MCLYQKPNQPTNEPNQQNLITKKAAPLQQNLKEFHKDDSEPLKNVMVNKILSVSLLNNIASTVLPSQSSA